MKKFILFLALTASMAVAQHRGFNHVVVVRPRVYVGSYGYYPGIYPVYPIYPLVPVQIEPKTCQKETIKDENGKKHQVLACKQADGTIKIYSPDTK